MACDGYHAPTVRTGYESIIQDRTSPLYAYTAKQPGRVKEITPNFILIEYNDKTTAGYQLGRIYGKAAGLTIPHYVTTQMKVGDKVDIGDCICYNTGFMEPDYHNPKRVLFKNYKVVKTVLLEDDTTIEDSSSITREVADSLSTNVSKIKDIVINFDQTVRGLLKPGTAVESDSVLCFIEDQTTSAGGLFSDESLAQLGELSRHAPTAKTSGVLEKIEVFYHGEIEDMSESLAALVKEKDRELIRIAKAQGKPEHTGSVTGDFRIEGKALNIDSACIRIYITSKVSSGIGDKGVFGNQLKTVFGATRDVPYVAENGEKIDAVFGSKSVGARIVLSPYQIGTTNTLLDLFTKEFIKAYEGK